MKFRQDYVNKNSVTYFWTQCICFLKVFFRSGRSTGQAEIEFSSMQDAERAKDQYNGVPLDGELIEIENKK